MHSYIHSYKLSYIHCYIQSYKLHTYTAIYVVYIHIICCVYTYNMHYRYTVAVYASAYQWSQARFPILVYELLSLEYVSC